MDRITELLGKYSKIGQSEKELKETVAKIISETINFEISPNKIKYINGTVIVKVEPIVKSEIALNKKAILERVVSQISKPKILDIK
jgi:asparagine N-glycosylation enzyme membrane subunit Stt3